MTVLAPFPYVIRPMNNLQPFTYQDGETYLRILEKLRVWINETLVPGTNDAVADALAQFQSGLANAELTVTDAKTGWDTLFDAFMADVTNQIGVLNDAAITALVQDALSATGAAVRDLIGSMALTPDELDAAAALAVDTAASDLRASITTLINDTAPALNVVTEFGAVADDATDNTAAFNAAMVKARATRREVYIPAGRYKVLGQVDISGCVITGNISGYESSRGTVLIGDGTNTMFKQVSLALDNITMGVHGIRFENVKTALHTTYSIYSRFSDLNVIDATGTGIICGDVTIIGPIWNIFERVKSVSIDGYGLFLGGKDWCNSNLFETCFFKGTTGAVRILCTTGFGAVDNKFHNTEITSLVGPGIVFDGWSRATTIEKCFMEPRGPAIVVNNQTSDLQLIGNVYGSTRNNIVGYGPYFVDHKASTLSVRVLGGWITTNASPEQADLRFIGSANPTELLLEYLAEPRISAASTGFKLHDEAIISAAQRVQRGNLKVQKHSAPTLELAYPDGTKPFTLKRNGTQGGEDFGVALTNDGNTALTIANNGMVILNGNLGTDKSTTATTPGTLARKLQIYDAAQNPLGFVLIYSGTA